jgi:hypothetical protein
MVTVDQGPTMKVVQVWVDQGHTVTVAQVWVDQGPTMKVDQGHTVMDQVVTVMVPIATWDQVLMGTGQGEISITRLPRFLALTSTGKEVLGG